jgi:hypothetical protein
MKRETSKICRKPLTLSTYRHVAIAISRRHLIQGGFKRDYDVEEQASDVQTTHTSWMAGRLYARGLEEAPGHVEARRAEFRMVSRRWHKFLGFSDPTLTKKRGLQDMTNLVSPKRARTGPSRREVWISRRPWIVCGVPSMPMANTSIVTTTFYYNVTAISAQSQIVNTCQDAVYHLVRNISYIACLLGTTVKL